MRTKRFIPAVADIRKNNARLAIEKKLTVLERILSRKVIGESFFPRSLEQFRVWEDAELGLVAIGSKSTLNTTENSRLKERASVLIERIKAKLEAENPCKSPVEALRERIRSLEEQLAALASDYHQSRDELLSERRRREQVERRVCNLTEELRSIRSLAVVKSRKEIQDDATSI